MSGITTHILDISTGRPAAGVQVTLERRTAMGEWEPLGTETTNNDGRARDLIKDGETVREGIHRLIFDVGTYFNNGQVDSFYEEITIAFNVKDASQHYHVPLLLSPFGYSTYRGS